MQTAYPAMITTQDNGALLVHFVDLPDTFTEGDTLADALNNGAEVLSAMLGWHLDQGNAITPPSAGVEGAHYIAPDAKTQAVLLLRHARGGRPMADLARGLDTSWAAAQRLDDPHHWPSLKQLDRAARVLGKRLVLRLE
jgi:antitoxin HicB